MDHCRILAQGFPDGEGLDVAPDPDNSAAETEFGELGQGLLFSKHLRLQNPIVALLAFQPASSHRQAFQGIFRIHRLIGINGCIL